MLRFAWKNLWRDRTRLAITVSGVALSVVLILVMNGLFAGASRQIASYIELSQADLFVAQAGVRNMHMATSVLAPDAAQNIRSLPGVGRAELIAYFATTVEWQGESDVVYVIGLTEGATMGGPWRMAEGKALPAPGEIVVSDRLRSSGSPGIGDRVRISGRDLQVVGLSQETKTLASTLVFMNREDAIAMRGRAGFNYVLVQLATGADRSTVARSVESAVTGVSVISRSDLAESDREMAMQMGIELLALMALVGFVIGLAVIALTIYVATVEQLRQYGVLKAVGASPWQLFLAILGQALTAAVFGYVAGVGLTALISYGVPQVVPGLEIDMDPAYVARVFGLVAVMGTLAALPPLGRVARVDPMDVFRQ